MSASQHLWTLANRTLKITNRPLIMGIVNVTDDSFSDGGLYASPDNAIEHGLRLIEQGADILDVGGESTRPDATPIPCEAELRRIEPVVKRLINKGCVPISIDTSKAKVAEVCLQLGAEIVNDVTGLDGDEAMPDVVRRYGAGAIVMHMQGNPRTMQLNPVYEDVVNDVKQYLESRIKTLTAFGLQREQLVVDPGIGFGKRRQHNLDILKKLDAFRALQRPLCLGVSRKGFIGKTLNREVHQRVIGSLTVLCHAMSKQAVQIIRVHDVAETRDAVTMWQALV